VRLVIVLAIAFIPSLIFAWVFEITPEGLKRDADVVRKHLAQIPELRVISRSSAFSFKGKVGTVGHQPNAATSS
jgi:hypothetical protein